MVDLHPLHCFKTIHDRHIDIEQDNIGEKVIAGLQVAHQFFAVPCFINHFMIRYRIDQVTYAPGHKFMIVGDDYIYLFHDRAVFYDCGVL
ncbi:hypothetical protein D3C80_1484270 [compost metagenome]